jgi:hypothetical protein
MRPLLAYVAKLNTLPSRLVQADADAVFAAGWDEAGLFHAIQVCAAFNLFNRLVEGAGVDFDYSGTEDSLTEADRSADYAGLARRIGAAQALWVEGRLGQAPRRMRPAEDRHVHRLARRHLARLEIGQRQRLADGIAVAARGDLSDRRAIGQEDRLGPAGIGRGGVDLEQDHLLARAFASIRNQLSLFRKSLSRLISPSSPLSCGQYSGL